MQATVHSALNFSLYTYRFSALNRLLCARLASTSTAGVESSNDGSWSANAYPFPKHPHPTPYEIFHLKPGASPGAIKSRYYELVRVHHPDAPQARHLPSHVSHARFQAVKAAHDVLTGKMLRGDFPSPSYPPSWGNKSHTHAYQRSGYHAHNVHAEWAHAANEAEEDADDQWKDRTILIVGIGTIGLAIFPFVSSSVRSVERHTSAAQNLSQARREAREYGMIRRAEIRRRVRGQELEQEYEE